MIALLLCSMSNVCAQSHLPVDSTAHWVKHLPDSTRLCDMSIPEAHDAATWSARSDMWRDQCYDEKKLFEMGVRAFDMRLFKPKDMLVPVQTGKVISYQRVTFPPCFSHGGDAVIGYNLKNIDDEIPNHFPTKDALKDEFMFIFFQWEGDGDRKEISKYTFRCFIDELVKQYGLTVNGEPRFIPFRKDLRLKDVRSKIILVGGEDYYTSNNITNQNKVPIAHITGGEFIGYDANDQEIKDSEGNSCRATFIGQNNYDASVEEKKISIKNGFTDWFDLLTNRLRYHNTECAFGKQQINSWYFDIEPETASASIQNGGDICADGKGRIGCNHYTYDFLSDYQMPYGFVRFDFIGERQHDKYPCYGDLLLDRVIMNNKNIHSFHTNEGKYVKDIVLATTASNVDPYTEFDKGEVKYKHSGRITTNNGIIRPGRKKTGIGYLTTDNVDEAVTDVVIVRATQEPADTITINGKKYVSCTNLTEERHDRNLNPDDAGNKIYLYYTKEPGDCLVKDLEVIAQADSYDLERMAIMWEENEGIYTTNNEIADLNDGIDVDKIPENTPHLLLRTHAHPASQAFYSYEGGDALHYLRCKECLALISKEPHTFGGIHQSDGYFHYKQCSICELNVYEKCSLEKHVTQTKESYEKGFGYCSKCTNRSAQEAEMDTNGKSFVINTPGQLYWYAAQVNHNGKNYSAKLNADIDLTNPLPAFPWEPIGNIKNSYDEFLTDGEFDFSKVENNANLYSSGFISMFDGCGHVIKGLQYTGDKTCPFHGLFGNVNGGTIKNLGLTESSISAPYYVGAIAGNINKANLYNIYTTASVSATDAENSFVGGMIGNVVDSCKIENSVYLGTCEKGISIVLDSHNTMNNVFFNNKDYPDGNKRLFSQGEVAILLNKRVKTHNDEAQKTDWIRWQQVLSEDAIPTFGDNGLSHKRTVNSSSQWGTVFLPYRMESDEKVQFYTAESVSISDNTGTIVLAPTYSTLPSVPYFFKRLTDDKDIVFEDKSTESDHYDYVEGKENPIVQHNYHIESGYSMYGTYENIEGMTSVYFLSGDKFWFAEDPISISPFRAWIKPSSSNTGNKVSYLKLVINDNGETTQVGEICDGQLRWFDDGKYVENGKVIVRKNGVKYNINGQRLP